MRNRTTIGYLLAGLLLLLSPMGWATGDNDEGPESGAIDLHFFWSKSCPHCQTARPYVEHLAAEYDWLQLDSRMLDKSPQNVALYVAMAKALGEEAKSVPAFFFCDLMLVGFDSAETTGKELEHLLQQCRAGDSSGGKVATADLPLIGDPLASGMSLPLLTLIIAGLDAFNPCAFFVLLFLLSLLVNARSRGRMLLVGGVFVFFSGAIYFLFMAAWLNLFLLTGGIPYITLFAALLALLIAAINIKDFFWFRQGPSLSIPQQAKHGLFHRMRGLIGVEHLPTLVLGTVVLAIAANSYELLCTAGFPMVYTRILTLNELSDFNYYLYLLLYNLIYVLPLLIIVLLFVYTMGRYKLSERQGRVLKLLSGLMMLGLGGVLLIAPNLLSNPLIGLMILLGALMVTAVLNRMVKAA
ncbi:MAG: thioredoxin family protein [Candidatus Thiodiazotropha sp.]